MSRKWSVVWFAFIAPKMGFLNEILRIYTKYDSLDSVISAGVAPQSTLHIGELQ
jgi:hypothetical protein